MWAIKFLNGPLEGQVISLKNGKNSIGRVKGCDIELSHNGISKSHAQIFITDNKVILSDSQSSNGTYLNGVRVQNKRISPGDKVQFHNIFAELIKLPKHALIADISADSSNINSQANLALIQNSLESPMNVSMDSSMEIANENMSSNVGMDSQQSQKPQTSKKTWDTYFNSANDYIDQVAFPWIYKLIEHIKLKYIILIFISCSIFLTTILSMIPVQKINSEHIIGESRRRALTIAHNLASINRKQILEEMDVSISTRVAEMESGVVGAFIIDSKSSRVLAPIHQSGKPLNLPFAQKARLKEKDFVARLKNNRIGASVPITAFNSETGLQTTKAHAIIIYKIDQLAFDSDRLLGLFMQILVIALIFGGLLFVLLYKIIEYPIKTINKGMDASLREGTYHIDFNYNFLPLQLLVSNVNSILSRISQEQNNVQDDFSDNHDFANGNHKTEEAKNLVNIIGWAALAVDSETGAIIAANENLNELLSVDNMTPLTILANIEDKGIRGGIESIIQNLNESQTILNQQITSDTEELYEITAQSIFSNGRASYIIITLISQTGNEEAYG